MSSRYNVLLHGSAAEAAETLGAGDYNAEELRAGICNALNRIAAIERAPAICADVRSEDRGEYEVDPPGASKPKIDKVCETCLGDVTFEGWISWNVEKQDFEVDDICDKGHHCKTCDGQTYAIDIIYKPLALVIEYGDDLAKERTYRFDTQAELTAFREGLQRGSEVFGNKFEITYTDEALTGDEESE